MTIFLYARVSTLDQDTGLQESALKKNIPMPFTGRKRDPENQ